MLTLIIHQTGEKCLFFLKCIMQIPRHKHACLLLNMICKKVNHTNGYWSAGHNLEDKLKQKIRMIQKSIISFHGPDNKTVSLDYYINLLEFYVYLSYNLFYVRIKFCSHLAVTRKYRSQMMVLQFWNPLGLTTQQLKYLLVGCKLKTFLLHFII